VIAWRALRQPLVIGAIGLFAVFFALGTWQVQRRTWKLELIARVARRIHAAPVAAPAMGEWRRVNAAGYEYRHVRAAGVFANDRETYVQAVTALGPGYWVLTPLQLQDGTTILVNRGFVPPQRRQPGMHGVLSTHEPAVVTGLLRMPEPKGAFLRRNDSAADRWFSRDIGAIARRRGLGRVAPYFIDAAGLPAQTVGPVGGLTVTAFRNSHLAYAITWYTLAVMAIGGAWIATRELEDVAEP